MAIRADAYHQPWSHLLDHISSAQSTLRQRRGHCFRKLIVGSNMLLDAFEQGCVPAVVSSASSTEIPVLRTWNAFESSI